MSGSIVTRAVEMPETDQAKPIWDDIKGYMDGIQINGTDILWAAFQHGPTTKSGLALPASFQRESGIQGIIGLIVKCGPQIGEEHERFGDKVPAVGQWAIIDTRYGIKFILGGGGFREGRHMRIVESKMIYALVDRPDWII